jgi:Fe-Mn family superoxide dismutase
MEHVLPNLPYGLNALAPHLSGETLQYHWGKHHRAYVDNLNAQIIGTRFARYTLEEIVRRSAGTIFHNAAQHFNHSFYWNCLSPQGGGEPDGHLADALRKRYGSFGAFRATFAKNALGLFGSGWCWLVCREDGKLEIEEAPDADCPLTSGAIPLLTCDLWEHAYYIDYRNTRARYLDAFWRLANWRFAEEKFVAAAQTAETTRA